MNEIWFGRSYRYKILLFYGRICGFLCLFPLLHMQFPQVQSMQQNTDKQQKQQETVIAGGITPWCCQQ
ncbi:MAG TPA: hypothetical protein H9733_04500 [Candidatus Anaerotignum merdipullorum]|nr:hypothetical protein [Candidatus Anaerotignum merdipullorum]